MIKEISLQKDKSSLNNDTIDNVISLMSEKGINDFSFSKQEIKNEKEKIKLKLQI